jgi:hypothetical protein
MTEKTTTYRNEKDVKKRVKALLDRFGYFWWMVPANGYGKSGVSDIHALKRGVFIAIETKFGSNKPAPLQIGFLNSIRAEDAFAFVVSDRNIDWFEAFLESFDISTTMQIKGEKVPGEHGTRMLDAISELSNKILDTAAPPASVIEAT